MSDGESAGGRRVEGSGFRAWLRAWALDLNNRERGEIYEKNDDRERGVCETGKESGMSAAAGFRRVFPGAVSAFAVPVGRDGLECLGGGGGKPVPVLRGLSAPFV